ncbi:MAG: SIR2 family protein [Deltaproteobacteria bacterium]|nr:SIR2 family protein [Deltaproteobacteria bacterium]
MEISETSTSPPPELTRAFSQRDLIVCVGPEPGASVGIPGLRALAGAIIERAARDDPSLDPAGLWARLETGRVSEVFQVVERSLGGQFQREVADRLDDAGHDPPPLLRALARLRPRLRAAYTVSLHRLLERAFAGRWPMLAEPRPDLPQRRNLVFKILGTLETPSTWVLTQACVQRELAPGAARQEAFTAAYRAHQMLLVGFAVDDPELQLLLDMTPATTQGHGPGHFIALADCSPTDRQLLEGSGLQVVDAGGLAVLQQLGESLASDTMVEPLAVPEPAPARRAWTWAVAGVLALGAGIAAASRWSAAPVEEPTNAAAWAAPRDASAIPRANADPTGGHDAATSSAAPATTSASATTSAPDLATASTSLDEPPEAGTNEALEAVDSPRARPKPTRCYHSRRRGAWLDAKGTHCKRDNETELRKRGCSVVYICD